jgi:hypothetical protein
VLYIIDASLTDADEEKSGRFLAAAAPLLDLAGTCPIRDEQAIFGKEPGSGDGVVLFNSTGQSCPQPVARFLRSAQNGGAVVMPVALDTSVRRPPDPVTASQSFDVVDELRRRDLSENRLEVVARAFGRAALSRVQPTCSKNRLRLFLCHRRADGEDTTARLDRALSARHPEHVFRDLVNVEVSEQAQDEIEKHLATADVIVFVDTPKVGESPWVARELELALGAHVPIVWVRIGEEGDRVRLAVPPAAEPHLTRLEVPDQAAAEELADAVLDTAFDLHRAQFRAATAAFDDLRTWADEHGATVRALDQRLMIYEIRYPAPSRTYPTRAPVDVLQLFGRHPTDDDQRTLSEWLDERSLGPHGDQCRSFDAAIMLDPYPITEGSISDWSVVESSRRYLQTVTGSGENDVQSDGSGPPGLLLLGAFPNGTGAQQALIDAVHAVTTTWVSMGGTVILGGHPTFTPLVIHAARLADPHASKEQVVIYQSLHFVTNDAVTELAERARAVGVEAGADRATSLTAMRTEMVSHEGIRAVVAIGGRTSEGGTHVPGIDEEISLARTHGLPVFLIGAAGGRAAELADAAASEQPSWASLGNPLENHQNEILALNDNYEALARLVWNATT